ncbi:MAG: hypothetical protein RDU30_09960 [Desulfovibrionaceae bacterium]|nr:hypothetical protein [Desulfovibrionaceae bacterium]
MFEWLRHRLNDGHVYCRLRDIGLPGSLARRVARVWKRLVHPLLYRGGR